MGGWNYVGSPIPPAREDTHRLSRIIAQIIGPHTHDISDDWAPLQDMDLAVGPGRHQYASFIWDDLWAIAPWLEERVVEKIDGPGLGLP